MSNIPVATTVEPSINPSRSNVPLPKPVVIEVPWISDAAVKKSLSLLDTTISTPDELDTLTVPSAVDSALRSPIVAAFIAVTTEAALVAVVKSTA